MVKFQGQLSLNLKLSGVEYIWVEISNPASVMLVESACHFPAYAVKFFSLEDFASLILNFQFSLSCHRVSIKTFTLSLGS
jgi:hypothetical protein